MNRLSVYLGTLYFFFGVTSAQNNNSQLNNLYFGVFISQDTAFDFSGFIPPLELGVSTINNSTRVLDDYFIQYVISNGRVSP